MQVDKECIMKTGTLRLWVWGLVGLFAGTASAQVNITINPTFDTTELQNKGPFELAFVLTDGSGTNDQNSMIGISNFTFGLGGMSGSVTSDSTGGFSGNLTAGVSLVDSSFFNLFGANFTPGNQLTFKADIRSSSIDSPAPDLFQFFILSSSGLPVPTTDASGQDSLITIDLDSSSPVVQTNALVSVPEPDSVLLFATSLAVLGIWRRKILVSFARTPRC
jgi:hypothetical protein